MTNIITFALAALSGLLLLSAATSWMPLALQERLEEPKRLRTAAGRTGVALGLLGLTLLWFVAVSIV